MSRTEGAGATLSVRVVPRSAKEEVAGCEGGALRIRLTAPPVEGKANEALCRFLAKALGVPRRSVTLLSGGTGRNKIVRIEGLTAEKALAALIPPGGPSGAGPRPTRTGSR
ncbi:MAG: DUF167 domain-containing protein [Thermodesulfobacteriota bacterium]